MFQFKGAWSFVCGGLSPPKPTRGDGPGTGHSVNMSWGCGQITSPLPFSFVSLWLFFFLMSREFRIKYYVYELEQLVQW